MKKALALLLALVMVLALCACGGSGGAQTASGGGSTSGGGSSSGGSTSGGAEPYHVKLELCSLSTVPSLEATNNVEYDINKYIKETLKTDEFVLDLSVVNISDFFTVIPMELAANEGPDLVMTFDMPSFVSNGYIIPLDPYLDNELKPTVDLIGNILNNGKLNGSVYMIPRYFGTVLDWKFIYNKDLVDGKYDMSKVKSLNDLDDCLAALKKAYPDEHFLVYNDQFDEILDYDYNVSRIGTYTATVGESTKLVNYYETDSYKDAIYKSYEYRQKGFCDPEGSANTLLHDAVVMSGSSKGVIMGHSADCESIAESFTKTNTYGATFDAVTICTGDLYTDTLGIGISYTSKNPTAAAKFINLLYTDEFIWEALIYGKEGQDYVWNADHTEVDYPEGLDFNTIPYNCMYSCGLIGNGFQGLPFANNNSNSSYVYGKELMDNAWAPPLYGFTPSNANVLNEIAAVSNVVDQYNDVLTYGDVNPDEFYPQFLNDLKAAGIDKIVADFQTQADEWVAANK